MIPRIVLSLLAALVLASPAAAQSGGAPGGSLPAFRTDRELVRFLRSLERPETPRPPPAAPAPAATATLPQPACTAPADTSPRPPLRNLSGENVAEITGRVTDARGCPEVAVLIRIASLNVGAATGADGTYRLLIPAARLHAGEPVQIAATRPGLGPVTRSITLAPGTRLTHDFRVLPQIVLLEDVVITGTAGAASITNNQHDGVDEGAIVKLHGDYLVILRRGRLFTVDVGGNSLRPVSMVNAFGDDGDPDAWYDEMLVSGDQVVVIGYSYDRGGTEVGLFRIDRQGGLHYRETYHLRSNDYYSSRNYASRLIGTRLILYAPVPADAYDDPPNEWMPAMRRWHKDAEDEDFRRIVRPGRVYGPGRALHDDDYPVMHTVTSCELGREPMACDATAVLGPWGRVFYVSPTSVYVWTSDWTKNLRRAPSTVYRIPLDGSPPSALGVEGSPLDQMSFLESGDGHLNVLVRSEGRGDGMWNAERDGGQVALLRVPLRRFGDGRGSAPAHAYRALPMPGGDRYRLSNRFVGRHLLYGAALDRNRTRSGVAYAVRWADGRLAQIPIPHGVDRVEVMGGDAVVVGTDSTDLHFTGIRLGREPRAAQRYVHPRAQQGEDRSHGFFYRADAPDQGVIGLPITGPGEAAYSHLTEESASVLFVENRDAAFRPLGQLAARPEDAEDDHCIASCVDWYGNSRPIFLRGRILALLGYEIVEGAVTDGRIREVRRAGFAPPAAVAAKN
ncbi:beta-propeller domain-containing protein [Longimicrobium sp.]|uniref:beta-propeller domain-containing protein n=1 Tax=Longimicrobium sp. TaxID=2029185 RepID=UPI003B3AC7E7